MNGHGFTSVFADDLERYLAFKESMGYYGNSRIWYLRNFDRYCADHWLENLDRDTVEEWVVFRQSSRPSAYRSWMSYIRDFGRWARINGNKNAYVLSDQWKASFIRSQRFFAYVTADLLQRSDHRSVQALENDIRKWVKGWNKNPKPFIWTKPAEQILESLSRLLQRTTGAGH